MSLALRRALAALGGAFGTLPLLPIARTIAERAAGPARLPGAERVAGDVKAGTWAELFVLLLIVPVAAIVFGRFLPDFIRKRGGFCVALPGIAMSSAFVLWRHGMPSGLALLAGAVAAAVVSAASLLGPTMLGRRAVPLPAEPVAPASPDEEPAELGVLPVAIVIGLILLAALRVVDPAGGAVELFEEGQILTPAGVYLDGGVPYRDTYPVHGWGTDGGLDAAAARHFGATLEVIRTRRWIWSVLGVALLALACWALLRRPLWSLAGFGLALCLCPYPSERQAAAFAGLAALVWAARSGRRRAWLAAGLVAAGALFYALEYGFFLVAAGTLTVGSLGLLERRWKTAAKTGLAFAAGVAVGSLPFLWFLVRRGGLSEFFHASFRELPSTIGDTWGLPAGSAIPLALDGNLRGVARAVLFGETLSWAMHVGVLVLAVTVTLWRSIRPGLSPTDRAAVAATWMAILALRGALGRADVGHLVMHGVFVALPAVWLVFRASRAEHGRYVLAPALAVVLALAARPGRAAEVVWNGVRGSSDPPECLRPLAGGGGILPCWQADEIEALRRWMDAALAPTETYFDFGNEPGLYFFLKRRPPVRFPCAPCYQEDAAQREVLAVLERERPPVVILSSGSWRDDIDGVSNRERVPLVAEYLDRHYVAAERLGPRTLARRRENP